MLIKRACGYAKADGQPCQMAPLRDRPYCFSHDPERAEEAAEARRLGGLRRRKEGTIAVAYDLPRHLVGGFIYARHRSGGDAIYLLSDFALAPKSRLSKLIAMLATSQTVIGRMEVKLMHRITTVYSTAFTDRPVSMKYRGIYDLIGRKPGILNYASKVRPQTPGQIYVEWFQRFVTNSRIKARLSELKLLEKNARYMKGPQFERLVENIRRDGVLTSFPLVHREGKALEVISGNHRVSAAIKAGIEESDVIEVTTPLTRQQFVALQLSHNAIAGQDDPNILRSLYDELDFGWKRVFRPHRRCLRHRRPGRLGAARGAAVLRGADDLVPPGRRGRLRWLARQDRLIEARRRATGRVV